ncbi:bifunctional 4-hydroxy-2-oxoglutarate aldolase/2-dehydro-3-deoxy-phosphogluconate aldolase [cf. Phormidesmis sp. LEGE 11477]|uniref:bifunctional 4-hydroxy-2-oxoglutarate aldolase/2-dehydro-3-deoxy-phosphogluconate aldolase n=1 Tax=cf. Phormidesmis sp. LEGE 11477 TaxID=1828680 RepID=UPI001D14BD82|nr:bifunctional 4-hydroxy-2-oxoglutarate aldolase/2-dehydro-3-deoxy-phosphogluconate aldolase [cf. Phormidesmis sp. LEGE 11477]
MTANELRADWISLLKRHRAIAIIRAPNIDQGVLMAQAAAAGGFRLIEVAWTNSAEPAAMVTAIRRSLPDCIVGVGSVLTADNLDDAIAAGAKFCFTPHVSCALIMQANANQIPIVAGAMTPTEIIKAWQAGASSVKVFPISSLGNETYIRSLLGPLGPVPLVPTGGVTSEIAPALIAAGAIAVGLSTALFPSAEVLRGDWPAIEARSRYLLTLLELVDN